MSKRNVFYQRRNSSSSKKIRFLKFFFSPLRNHSNFHLFSLEKVLRLQILSITIAYLELEAKPRQKKKSILIFCNLKMKIFTIFKKVNSKL